jgi:hypothetical protein
MSFNTTTGAFTGTPTTVAGATAYTVTATNASGSASATFTFTVTTSLAAPAFTLSSSSESRTVNIAATGFTVSSTGGAIASFAISPAAPSGMTFNTTTGAFTGTPTSVASATVYTVTATNASGSASATFTFTVIVATCATGGTCVVGDTGPGGGFVFYYLAAGFSCGANFTATGSPTGGLCHYLEVASTTGTVHWTDDVITWAVAAQNTNDVTSVTNDGAAYLNSLGVGLGYQNSLAIVAQGNDSTSAAGAARAYAGGSKSDWYLPSAAELNLLCQWGRGTAPDVTTACSFSGSLNSATYGAASAALISNMYWSSSEGDASNAWQQDFGGVTRVNLRSKAGVNWVRPVRAF